MMDKSMTTLNRVLVVALVVGTAPVWLALLAIVVLARTVFMVALYLFVWSWWIGRQGRRTLFVYSDSPNWKEYVERVILPRLPENSVVLNWSHRSQWHRFAVPNRLFRTFAGSREFNPIGLVFERFTFVADYRFWQPFRDLKHGRPDALRVLEQRFFSHLAG
jgi:hypothetical protein